MFSLSVISYLLHVYIKVEHSIDLKKSFSSLLLFIMGVNLCFSLVRSIRHFSLGWQPAWTFFLPPFLRELVKDETEHEMHAAFP